MDEEDVEVPKLERIDDKEEGIVMRADGESAKRSKVEMRD